MKPLIVSTSVPILVQIGQTVPEILATKWEKVTYGHLFLYYDASDRPSRKLRFILPHGESSHAPSLVRIGPAVAELLKIRDSYFRMVDPATRHVWCESSQRLLRKTRLKRDTQTDGRMDAHTHRAILIRLS